MGQQPELDKEIEARARASEAFHAHPSNPSSCEAWLAQARNMQCHCPCEDRWRDFAAELDEIEQTFARR